MNHFNISMLKSTIRIIGCGLCLFSGSIIFLAWGFLFAEILVQNRDKIKESESFVLTLQKDKMINEVMKWNFQ